MILNDLDFQVSDIFNHFDIFLDGFRFCPALTHSHPSPEFFGSLLLWFALRRALIPPKHRCKGPQPTSRTREAENLRTSGCFCFMFCSLLFQILLSMILLAQFWFTSSLGLCFHHAKLATTFAVACVSQRGITDLMRYSTSSLQSITQMAVVVFYDGFVSSISIITIDWHSISLRVVVITTSSRLPRKVW